MSKSTIYKKEREKQDINSFQEAIFSFTAQLSGNQVENESENFNNRVFKKKKKNRRYCHAVRNSGNS